MVGAQRAAAPATSSAFPLAIRRGDLLTRVFALDGSEPSSERHAHDRPHKTPEN
jgi:hypothetical protein